MRVKVSDLLAVGKENARSSDDLCSLLGISKRELTQAVNRERRAGAPICASSDSKHHGYYLAENKEEMQRFCRSLFHRAGEIHKTRRACLASMENLPESETSNGTSEV